MADQDMAARFNEVAARIGPLGDLLRKLPLSIRAQVQEIRLRADRPIVLVLAKKDLYIRKDGQLVEQVNSSLQLATRSQIEDVFRLLCDSSVYAHQHEICNGFVTLRGGHRAGLCGTAVLQDGSISNLRDISGINLRIAREFCGAANSILSFLKKNGRVCGTILVGPPGCGKTTLLRDLARQLSLGALGRCRVVIVDERGEIAAVSRGVPQNNVGQCDVLDGYPKGEGILQAVRCLSPDVIICDEIGGEADAHAVATGLNAGATVIASAHASSIKELVSRISIRPVPVSYTHSDAADDLPCVDLGGRRIIKKKKKKN